MSEKLCTLRNKGGGGGKYTETSLWTNSAPTSDFAAQTVSLSDSIDNYKYIKIKYCFSASYNTGNYLSDYIISVDEFKKVPYPEASGTARLNYSFARMNTSNIAGYRRFYYASSTTVRFGSTDTNALIPLEILGLNELDHGTIEDYATISVATTGTSNVCTGYAVASNSNKFTTYYTNGSASGTITVLEEGLYDYVCTTQIRGTGTATVNIGNQSYTTGKGEVYISANTVCTASVGGTAGSLGLAGITLVRKS